MNEQRHDLDEALLAYGGAPAHLPGFEERLRAGMEQADRDMGRARRGWSRVPRLFAIRRPLLATAVVAAVATVVAVAVLVGLPGVSRISGPEPVSAAAVIQKALDAISSGETLQADIIERYVTSVTYPGLEVEYFEVRFRMQARSDGSLRFTQTGPSAARGGPRPPDAYALGVLPADPGNLDWAYDATNGTICDFFESSESPRYVTDIVRGTPLGPPDAWANLLGDLSAAALALQAGSVATVSTVTYDGRPAWVLTMSGSLQTRAPDEIYSVTVDQETCLPVRVRAIDGNGIVQLDYGLHDLRLNEPIPDAAFRFSPPAGTVVSRSDAGFRRASLDRIAAGIGYDLLLPTWLPDGFEQKWTATAAKATTANLETRGRDVVEVQYVRGFDDLTVTTRAVLDPVAAAEADPVELETNWAHMVKRPVLLTKGAFAGATAQVVVAPRMTVPHLWVVKDGVMLTVAGRATVEEFIAIAESVQPYVSGAASTSASTGSGQ